jgi:hypothetical protein
MMRRAEEADVHEVGRLLAVVPADTEEAVIADLAGVTIRAELVEPRPGAYMVEDESRREHLKSAERGLFVGPGLPAPVGLLVVLVLGAIRELPWVTQLLPISGSRPVDPPGRTATRDHCADVTTTGCPAGPRGGRLRHRTPGTATARSRG